jgi:hypothetical protein
MRQIFATKQALLVGLFGALVAASAACSSGKSSTSSPETAGSCSSHLNESTPCGACLAESCCGEVSTCFDDSSCAACVNSGGKSCGNDAPTTDLNSCISGACGASCNAGMQTMQQGMNPSCGQYLNTSSACGACLERSCCPQVSACFSENSCAVCVKSGGKTCGNDAPTTALNSCISSACGSECS